MSEKSKKQPQEQAFVESLTELIDARQALIWVTTDEEVRAFKLINDAARVTGREILSWTCISGLVDEKEKPIDQTIGVVDALNCIMRRNDRSVYVLFDLHSHMRVESNQEGHPAVIRRLKDSVAALSHTPSSVVIVSPFLVPVEDLKKMFWSIELPLPDAETFKQTLLKEINAHGYLVASRKEKNQIASALRGLTYQEAEDTLAREIARHGKIDITVIPEISKVRAERVKGVRGLMVIDPDPSVPEIGGLDMMKEWLQEAFKGFSKEGQAEGVEPPRGILLLGPPGVGKSLAAKEIARMSGMLLLRFDPGAIFEKYVGSSEENMRRALATVDACAPCVLWIDEIEKGFGQRHHEGESSSPRVRGFLLTWMQERKTEVFIVATTNDVLALPKELTRQGRFDEIFYVDLPGKCERREVFTIHLRKRGKDPEDFDLDLLVENSDGYTGAEIEQAIKSALRRAFAKKENLATEHIREALRETRPLSVSRAEEIKEQREWAKARARMASSQDPT